jgi:hypothetical protein
LTIISVSMPRTELREYYGGSTFYLNGTGAPLDCSDFDKKYHEATTGDYSSYKNSKNYACSSIAPGSNKDVAKHWHAPFKLSTPARNGVIAAGVIGFVLVCLVLSGWWEKKHLKPPKPAQPLRITNSVALRDLEGGVTREQDEDDELPKYARVGRVYEVPPDYEQHSGESGLPPTARDVSPAERPMETTHERTT